MDRGRAWEGVLYCHGIVQRGVTTFKFSLGMPVASVAFPSGLCLLQVQPRGWSMHTPLVASHVRFGPVAGAGTAWTHGTPQRGTRKQLRLWGVGTWSGFAEGFWGGSSILQSCSRGFGETSDFFLKLLWGFSNTPNVYSKFSGRTLQAYLLCHRPSGMSWTFWKDVSYMDATHLLHVVSRVWWTTGGASHILLTIPHKCSDTDSEI